MTEVLRYTAFSDDPAGGNPAGVVLDARELDEPAMQALAAEVGYSETAFVTGGGKGRFDVRYFSPAAEVPFCGHATIALAVAYAERHGAGTLALDIPPGRIEVSVADEGSGPVATLTSVAPRVEDLAPADLEELLAALAWRAEDLDPALPPRVGFTGIYHPLLAAATRERLAALDYDFERLRALMLARDWTTIALVYRRDATTFDARDPFPVGGVVEDPATGSAAAALGAYLRALELISPPARLEVHQGDDLGRPSLLIVDVPEGLDTGIRVSGRAVPLP
jgi:PhzF family phenazine biosynthesis protein